MLAACGTTPHSPIKHSATAKPVIYQDKANSQEVVLYAMGLMDTDYRFGGNNPESGLDCSGMVSYIYQNALGMRLPHNAYQIAQLGIDIPLTAIQPGDLLFFNTLNKPYSHVGIYIGDDRFIHAPSSNGKISISSIKTSYYSKRLEGARSFFY